MLKRLWYYILRLYLKAGLWFFCDELSTSGLENIPKQGAVIFTANHNNAFLDAILIISKTKRITYSLTRSDVFKKKNFRFLLNSLHLLPIYRVRDGLRSVSQNIHTFQKTTEVLNREHAVIMFPEAQHHNDRQLKKISKGFTRVAFEAASKNPNIPLHIVPVGINYHDFHQFPTRVHLNFGKPIDVLPYYNKDDIPNSSRSLTDKTEQVMQTLVTHIEDEKNYQTVLNYLNNQHVDFTKAQRNNELIANWEMDEETITLKVNHRIPWYLKALQFPLLVNNFLPLLIWRIVSKKIKDNVFIGSMKFGVGVVLFPMCYLLLSIVIYLVLGPPIAIFYLLFSIFSMNALKALSN